jgi:hypothetical protein
VTKLHLTLKRNRKSVNSPTRTEVVFMSMLVLLNAADSDIVLNEATPISLARVAC